LEDRASGIGKKVEEYKDAFPNEFKDGGKEE